MNKKLIAIIFSISMIVILLIILTIQNCFGCSNITLNNDYDDDIIPNSDVNIKSAFFYTKNEFIEHYNKVLAEYLNSDISDVYLFEEEVEDFKYIDIEKSVYGLSYFIKLPFDKRKLTEIEMMMLIRYNEFQSPNIFLDAYTTSHKSNRELTRLERLQKKRLDMEYLYNNLRPNNAYTNRINMGDPFYIVSAGLEKYDNKGKFESYKFWFYPISNMSQEQLLQLTDEYYSNISTSYFIPSSTQIQYTQIDSLIPELIDKYKIADKKPEALYFVFVSLQNIEEDLQHNKNINYFPADAWNIEIHFSDYNDILLKINADNGELIEWKCMPVNYYGLEYPDYHTTILSKRDNEFSSNYSIEEIITTYLASITGKDAIISKLTQYETKYPPFDFNAIYTNVTIDDGNKYEIIFKSDDKKLLAFKIQ